MKYKLGSQLDYYEKTEDGQDKFEWNLCLLDQHGFAISSVFIGTRAIYDPVIRKARELVNLLNGETLPL